MSTEKKPGEASAVAEVNEKLYAAMAMDPEAGKEMVTAKAVVILYATIRHTPEQSWPGSSQQHTTHRYLR